MATNRGGKRVNRNLTPAQKQQIRLDKKYGKGTQATGSRFKNPLDVQVDSAILSQTTPYTEAQKAADRQAADEKAYLAKLGVATQGELEGIGKSIQDRQNTSLGAAATTQTFDADRYKRNLDFLNGVLGGSVTDAGALSGVGEVGAQQNLVANTTTASSLAQSGQAMQRDLGTMRSSQSMRTQEGLGQRETARVEANKKYAATIAGIRANRAALKQQMYGENLKNDIMRQEAAQGKEQAAWERAFQEKQLAQNQSQFDSNLSAEADAAAGKAASDAAGDSAAADGKMATTIQKLYKTLVPMGYTKDQYVQDANGKSVLKNGARKTPVLPAKPFTTLFKALKDNAIDPDTAAITVAQWTRDNRATWGKTIAQQSANARGLLSIMSKGGVSRNTAKAILQNAYGAEGWRMATGKAIGGGVAGPVAPSKKK